ncbi:MAG: PDZ domain-containing protein [Acidobacteriota bacterium]
MSLARSFALSLALSLVLGLAPSATADDETLLLQDPTISRDHVVFRHADDLWVASRRGGEARRLTSSSGSEYSPRLSPDGERVAFTGQYEGNRDVYVMPVSGGAPQRLTWHPGSDTVRDWHPDGRAVLFGSNRHVRTWPGELFQVGLDESMPTKLELPKVAHASLNDAATHFAYTPLGDAFGTWKRYRGGRTTPVWIFDRSTHEVEEIPHVNASDTFPCWLDGDVYFASDRDGVMNLYRFRPGARQPEQLTDYDDFHVRAMDCGGGAVVFEQAGRLHVYEPAAGRVKTLKIVVRTDGLTSLPRWQDVKGHVRWATLSPNGKRAVFEARGEIITVPKEHGDARNLTQSSGVHDRSPQWSPDGKKIAWFSDAGGEYQLLVGDRRGRDEPKSYDLKGGGFYYNPQWSPDGKHVLFYDKTNRLAYVTLSNGRVTEVARIQGSLGVVHPSAAWSPDSKWIAFTNRNPRTLYDHVALYELRSRKVTQVTDDFAESSSPAFSPDGKHLFFSASVNVGPKLMGLNMSTSASRDWDSDLYVAVLQADGENPLAPKSDEAKKDDKPKEDDSDEEEEDDDDDSRKPKIDLEGLDQRILALPVDSGRFWSLRCAGDKLLYVESPSSGDDKLMAFDFDERESDMLVDDVNGFVVSGDGKSLLVFTGGGYKITNAKGKDGKKLKINSVKVRVEPQLEWPQVLREVWRIERDYFYDANMHGVDWDAMWDRWEPFLPHVRHRSDLTMLIRELIGELACGHEYVWGGESPDPPAGVSVGLLGADFTVERNRHRIARILKGQNWRPGDRAPLTEPGVEAREGDYLIAVNGEEVWGEDNLYRMFQNTANKQVELTLSSRPLGGSKRTTTVVPVGSESALRFQTWVEDNRRRVDQLSGGRLAYVYMRNTGGSGRQDFDRDFYSQLHKKGLILDERYNGGGQVADYIIEVLSRKVTTYWMNREQWLGYSPATAMEGPKVMIINESAGSGGDWMPWAFSNAGLGPLVGTRTWGGLVGISGYPALMDGGAVTAANFGVMDTDGNWIVENVGVAPDHEVVEYPKDVIAGGDPQLEKAVALALEALERMPEPKLPVYHAPAER